MKLTILIIFSLFSLSAFPCSPPPYVAVPDKCKGKTERFIRKFVDISTDLPKGIVTHSESLISFEIQNNFTIDCLETYHPEWKWLKPYAFKDSKYYRSCHITMSTVCEPKQGGEMGWYCDTSPDTCGRPIHPEKYEIEPSEFKEYDNEALKVLNAKIHFFDRKEERKFVYQETEKFLKFKVRWSLNPSYGKNCDQYKDGF